MVKGTHVWNWTNRIYSCILEDAISRDDIIFKLVAAKVTTTVDKVCANYLDCRDPQTETQFIDALQTCTPAPQRYRLRVFIATKIIISKGKWHGATTATRVVIRLTTAGGSRNLSIPNNPITMMVLQ